MMSSMSFFSCRITAATLKRGLQTTKDTEVRGAPACTESSCSGQTHQRGDEHPSQPSIVKCAALPWHVKFRTATPWVSWKCGHVFLRDFGSLTCNRKFVHYPLHYTIFHWKRTGRKGLPFLEIKIFTFSCQVTDPLLPDFHCWEGVQSTHVQWNKSCDCGYVFLPIRLANNAECTSMKMIR